MILRRKYNGAKIDTEVVDAGYGLQRTDYRKGEYMDLLKQSNGADVSDLIIYQVSYKLMLEIHKLTLKYPKIEQYSGIADQLRRSSKSITANIVEGFGKQSFYKDDFKRHLIYAVASCDESVLWIRVSYDLGYIPNDCRDYFLSQYKVLVKQISSFIKSLK